jgi:cell division protein FtsW
VQLVVNIGGVLGLMPLSGKPVPFLSYGGSSIMSCCILVGLILSVSRSSILPETEHDRARSQLRVADGTAARGGTGVGEVMTRSESRAQASAPTFRVVEGGASAHAEVRAHAEARAARRASESRSSRDLMDPASRLRCPDTGPQVRMRTQSPHLN